MSEFWSRRSQTDPYVHQLASLQLRYHDGIKNASSAAHIYGRNIVQAEAFTVMRDVNYDRDPFELKDIGDRAFCAGMNRNMLCFFVCQADEQSKPGYGWPGVGMEFGRHVTWWHMSSAWLTYLARCQHLLQAGRFVADVCYFQGEWVPAYVPAKWAMDPSLPPGSDCDTINAEALISRATAGDKGRLVLPDGQSYRYLVLWQGGRWGMPSREVLFPHEVSESEILATCPEAGSGIPLALSVATLRKLKNLVAAGVTLVGPRPMRSIGLNGYPESDAQVKALAEVLWGQPTHAIGVRKVGKGRVIWGQSVVAVMRADSVLPDLEIHENPETKALPPNTLSGIPHPGSFDWIHRTNDGAEVYFIANLRNASAAGQFNFRIRAKQPELWDPVTGEIRILQDYAPTKNGRTTVPLEFARRQSYFIVFRQPASVMTENGGNFPDLRPFHKINGPWEVCFDPDWGGPEKAVFEKLEDWTSRSEEGIKYYSGTSTYRRTFDLPEAAVDGQLYLDLGKVKNLARVRLNGMDLGVLWTAPWRVDITQAVKHGGNKLEIDVANLWFNRLIGDAGLPEGKRLTATNVAKLNAKSRLMESGLLGPVTLHSTYETLAVEGQNVQQK